MTNNLQMEYIPIKKIEPNKLNPRENYEERSNEMQQILKERGWETGITCYKEGSKYIILSGHRRWYAASQLKEKEIPVFIVPKPETELEELEMLGSAQGAQEDWSSYEWALYTFNLWNVKKKPKAKQLATKLKVSERTVANRVKIFLEYDNKTIQEPLQEGRLTVTLLADLAEWVNRLQNEMPKLVEELSPAYIKQRMVEKALNKQFLATKLRKDKSMNIAKPREMRKFIESDKISLQEFYASLSGEETETSGTTLEVAMSTLKRKADDIKQVGLSDEDDYDEIEKEFKRLLIAIDMKSTELEEFTNKK